MKAVMEAVFGCNRDQIDLNSSPDTIEGWDSYGHMNLILALENEFGVEFDETMIVEMVNIEMIVISLKELLDRSSAS